jgi:hypothetical protein
MHRQIHPSLFLCDPNLWIDMKGYYASTRPDSCLIRKAIGSGSGHSGWKWLPFTMSPSTSGTWKWGNKCTYLQGHRQSPWQIHTKRGWWYGSNSRMPPCRRKVLSSSPSTAKGKRKKIFGDKDIAQWESVCPACAKPWVQFPSIAKSKKW